MKDRGYTQVVERAQKEDLQRPQKYLVSFMRNSRGQIVIDRRFNTSQLVSLYLDKPVPEDVITWNPDNPNQLKMALPGADSMQFLPCHVTCWYLPYCMTPVLASVAAAMQSCRVCIR